MYKELNDVLNTSTELNLFSGSPNQPSIVCITFSEIFLILDISDHIYRVLVELQNTFDGVIRIHIHADFASLILLGKTGEDIINIPRLKYNLEELDRFTCGFTMDGSRKYNLLIGGMMSGLHNIIRPKGQIPLFDSCIINYVNK